MHAELRNLNFQWTPEFYAEVFDCTLPCDYTLQPDQPAQKRPRTNGPSADISASALLELSCNQGCDDNKGRVTDPGTKTMVNYKSV